MDPVPHPLPSAPEDQLANPEFDNNPWPAHTDANHFHVMMSKVDLLSFGPAGELPPPTCREVVCNAMASVRFLDDLGEDMIVKRSLGIDRYGRLCKVGRSDLDFRDMFCQFVANIRWKLRQDIVRAITIISGDESAQTLLALISQLENELKAAILGLRLVGFGMSAGEKRTGDIATT